MMSLNRKPVINRNIKLNLRQDKEELIEGIQEENGKLRNKLHFYEGKTTDAVVVMSEEGKQLVPVSHRGGRNSQADLLARIDALLQDTKRSTQEMQKSVLNQHNETKDFWFQFHNRAKEELSNAYGQLPAQTSA